MIGNSFLGDDTAPTRPQCVAIAVDALVVQSFGAARSTEETKEMIVDAVCAAVLLMERLAVNERAEVVLTALLALMPARLQEIRNGRPVGG